MSDKKDLESTLAALGQSVKEREARGRQRRERHSRITAAWAGARHGRATGGPPTECQSTQFGDSMVCKCGLQYDTNDDDPPTCPVTGASARASGRPGRA